MAKINNFIAEYKETITLSGITPGDTKPPKVVIRRFVRLFKAVTDSRMDAMIDYPLVEILLISFLAILGNASTWAEIANFAETKKRWLKKFIPLKNGVPSHDTFRRVFSLIDSDTLQLATVDFLRENIAAIRRAMGIPIKGYRQICVDGKVERGTGRKYGTDEAVSNLQTLHIYDASDSICLYSCPIASKTNEIPVAQAALRKMNLKGCIVSFDAMHTQTETIEIIAKGKGEYIGGLKGNQSGFLEAVTGVFTDKLKKKIMQSGHGYYETSEKAHSKIEKRCFYLTPAACGKAEWKGLKSFVLYEKYTYDLIKEEEYMEVRYYITSLKDVELAAEAIRGHWAVEDKLHWHLDYSFCEDDNSTIDKNAFQNYSLMNKLVLSLCKLAQPLMKNNSIRIIRKQFGWDFEQYLSLLLATFDDIEIIGVIEDSIQKNK